MKSLFFSINNILSPHFEAELELMLNHINCGGEVKVIVCNGELASCFSNLHHKKLVCRQCIYRRKKGLQRIGLAPENMINLPRINRHKDYDLVSDVDELKCIRTEDGFELGLSVSSTLISLLRDHKFSVMKYRGLVLATMQSSLHVYYAVMTVLRQIKPDLIYIFNGRFADSRPAVRAAQQLGVNYICHERAGCLERYALYNNCLPHDLTNLKIEIEHLWEIGRSDKVILGEKWFKDRRGKIPQSWYSFTTGQIDGHLPVRFNPKKRNIAIFNSSMDEYETISEWGNPIYVNELDAIEQLLEHFKENDDYFFHLRVHPNLSGLNNAQMQELRKLLTKGYKSLNIIWPHEPVDTYALIENCEKSITFISTVGVEACYWGKPSILAGRSPYEDLDCCYIPKSHEEFMLLVSEKLVPKSRLAACRYGYWQIKRGHDFKYFVPDGIVSGYFLGKRIPHGIYPILQSICERLSCLMLFYR